MSQWSPLWALPRAQREPALRAARYTAPVAGAAAAKSARRAAARRARRGR